MFTNKNDNVMIKVINFMEWCTMNDKFSFYLQQDNSLFKGKVLTVCYKADSNEINEYGLTNENVLLLIKNKQIDNFQTKSNIDYF